MPPHPLKNFEIQKYYQNEPRFNGVYSRNNLPKKKDGADVINLDEYTDNGVHWIRLLYFVREVKLFISIVLVLNMFLKKLKNLSGIKNIKANIFPVQENISIMCGYFCIGFVDFMLTGKKLTNLTSMFCPYDFERNDSIILSFFKDE